MLGLLAPLALKLGAGLLGFAEKRADAKVEQARIQAGVDIKMVEGKVEMARTAASVVQTAMQHKIYWVAWALAALPASSWFGWGMMDSLFNGALPDVAELPPQLLKYFDVVFSNIFYAGTGLAATQIVAKAIGTRK